MHVPVSSVGFSPVGGSNFVRLRTETRYNSLGRAYQTVTNVWEYGTVTDGVFMQTSTVTTQQRITEQVFDAQGRVRLFTRYGSGADALVHDLKRLLAESR